MKKKFFLFFFLCSSFLFSVRAEIDTDLVYTWLSSIDGTTQNINSRVDEFWNDFGGNFQGRLFSNFDSLTSFSRSFPDFVFLCFCFLSFVLGLSVGVLFWWFVLK